MDTTSHLPRLGLATVLLGAFLAIADFFIVNVALPTIEADLHSSPATLQLVVAGYGVPYALLLVLGGRLGDLFGRRRLFMLGMASFTVCSLLCGLAPNDWSLIAFRALQGASAAFMVPQVLATIQATRAGQARLRAIALYGTTAGIAAAVGQLAGGALIAADLAGTEWRLIFLVNVPLGILGLFLAWRSVPATVSHEPHRIDLPGTLLLAATLLALLVPLTEGRTLGWPAWSIALLAAVVPLGAAFALVERRLERTGHHPIVPPSMLRLPGMHRGLLIAILFFTGFAAFMFVSALTFQQGAHLSPFQSGLALLPMAVSFLLTSLVTARMVARFGPTVLTMGALIQAAGLTGLAFTLWQTWPTVDPVTMAPAMIVAGIGQAFVLSPLFGFILAGVPAERAGVGSGILATTQQAALALGVATLGSMFLSLSEPDSIGFRDAFVAVLAAQVAIAFVVAITSRTMPRPQRAPAPVIRPEPVTAGD